MNNAPTRLLSSTEAASWLQLHPGHLANLRYRHAGPPFVKLGSAVRYRASDLEAWVEAGLHV